MGDARKDNALFFEHNPTDPNLRSVGFNHLIAYLVIMNRAEGLYGRIFTEVVSTDRT